MKNMNTEGDACLLTYWPSTYPTPLQVSTDQTPATGILNTAALSNGAVYCNEIVMYVPVGDGPPNRDDPGYLEYLFVQSPMPTASCNTSKWAITSVDLKSGRELGLTDDNYHAEIIFDCRSESDYLIDYNLVLGIQGTMTQYTANCDIIIVENSGTDPNNLSQKRTSYSITASAPQFYIQNFVATAPASPTVPATEFANGADIQFEWESNGSYFELYKKNDTTPIYSGQETNFKLSGGVSTDTTFFLVGMMSANPSGDSPSDGYQPIYLYDALTITISNPDLTPQSAKISGDATVGGKLGVKGQTSLSDSSIGGTLGVAGQTTLANATVNGTLGVTGDTTLVNTKVTGTLNATGQTSLANTNIAGLATLTGGLLGTGNFASLLSTAQSIQPGKYTGNTDGLVLGFVSGSNGTTNKLCVCWIGGQTVNQPPELYLGATGGNLACFDSSGKRYQFSNNQSFLMPTRKGVSWEVFAMQGSTNQVPATFNFWWIPLGTGSLTPVLEKVADQQPPFDVDMFSYQPANYEEKVETLVAVLQDILDQKLTGEHRERLRTALLDFRAD